MSDLKPVQNLPPFTKFCCSIGAIPTSYLVSMSYEEQLLWLCNYLANTVIPTLNNNGEAVTELQNLYLELKSYVDNYFQNLDIQTEINNKLDAMVEDGTFDEILNQDLLSKINNQINNISSTLNSLSQDNNVNKSNISNLQSNVSTNTSSINQLEGSKANTSTVSNLETKVDNLVSGNPKGAYDTLTDLQEDYPSGTQGIFIVRANMHWYYYNNGWKDGGAWQSPNIQAKSLNSNMLNDNAVNFLITNNQPINIKPATKTISITNNVRIAYNNRAIDIPAGEYSYDDGISGNYYIIYDFTTSQFKEISYLPLNTNGILIASVYNTGTTINPSYCVTSNLGAVQVNGLTVSPLMFTNSSLLHCSQPFIFDISSSKINITVPVFHLICGNYRIENNSSYDLTIENPDYTSFFVYYDLLTNQIKTINATSVSTILPNGIYLFGCSLINYAVTPLSPLPFSFNAKQMCLIGDSMFYDSRWASMSNRIATLYKVPTPLNNGMPSAGFSYKSSYANNQNFNDRIQQLYLEGTQFKYLAVIGGTNDFDENIPLGTIDDTSIDTFAGAVNSFIQYVASNFKDCIVTYYSPLKRFDMTTNSLGLTLDDYVSLYEQICKKYGVPFVNLYDNFIINQFNYSYWLRTDLLHPTDECYRCLAGIIYSDYKKIWYGNSGHLNG